MIRQQKEMQQMRLLLQELRDFQVQSVKAKSRHEQQILDDKAHEAMKNSWPALPDGWDGSSTVQQYAPQYDQKVNRR